MIIGQLDEEMKKNLCHIKQENFYFPLTEHQKSLAENGELNFDHPGSGISSVANWSRSDRFQVHGKMLK